jgi:hypothetical protein
MGFRRFFVRRLRNAITYAPKLFLLVGCVYSCRIIIGWLMVRKAWRMPLDGLEVWLTTSLEKG